MANTASNTGDKSSAKLAAEGWEKRSTNDEPRLSELIDMYRELGYEVYLRSFVAEEEPGCSECMALAPEKYKTVYTRKAS